MKGMGVLIDALIDTNVVLNYITEREDPFRDESKRVVELCARERFYGFIAFHSLSIIWYALRKRGVTERRFWLRNVCGVLTVVGASHEQALEAIDNGAFKDFEDCLQDECAQSVGAQYLVTCNVKDFEHAKTRVCTPGQFLAILSGA
ncbi:MAG: PIN domain-containing protein [Synergistaceae bacterium]|nr:PIN domain-containing protein [Synergistaceae bacterium]